MKKVLINLPDELLSEIDNAAAQEGMTRSRFIRNGLYQVLRLKHKLEIEEKMKRGYEEMAAINLQWAQLGLFADEKAFSAYEAALSEDDHDDSKR